jgi:hypothetical protein
MKKEDPCWDDYEMIGTKKKNGKTVPNCVPKQKNEELTIDEMFSEIFSEGNRVKDPDHHLKEEQGKTFRSLFTEMYDDYYDDVAYGTVDDIKYQLMSIINDASNILDHIDSGEPPHWLKDHLGSIHHTLASASAFFGVDDEEEYEDDSESDYYDYDVSEARKSTTEPAADHHYTLVNINTKRRIGHGSVYKTADQAHGYHKMQAEYSKDKDTYKNNVKVMSVGDAKKHGVPHSDFAGLKTAH